MSATPPGAPGTVAGDLLLLAVGPRSSWRTRGPVRLVVGAGSLADELLAGRPLGDVGPDRRAVAGHLVQTGRARLADVTAAQVAAGTVEPSRTMVWRLFPRDGLAVRDEGARARVVGRLVAALQPGSRPAPADAALAALASVAGLARAHAVLTDRHQRAALREHVNGLAASTGPDLAEVVMALRRALGRAGDGGDGAVLFVPASDGDGYGDSGGAGDSGGGDGGGDGGGGGGD